MVGLVSSLGLGQAWLSLCWPSPGAFQKPKPTSCLEFSLAWLGTHNKSTHFITFIRDLEALTGNWDAGMLSPGEKALPQAGDGLAWLEPGSVRPGVYPH